jgi:hypothetical protein
MKCPFHSLFGIKPKHREGLPAATARIAALPVDERGYPIPFFVSTLPDGSRDFRMADPNRRHECIRSKLCWVCGQPLGRFKTFVIGPMCSVNRVSSEPPSHLECADYSVKGCPFLTKPQMVRREDEVTDALGKNPGGEMIRRNPGVTCLWTIAGDYALFGDGRGGILIQVPDPAKVEWFREGRMATRTEVVAALDSGLPILREACGSDAEEHEALDAAFKAALKFLPA